MPSRSLEQWLAWQDSLNPAGIDSGLERCREVASRMGWPAPPFLVIGVGGTNGKGSIVALLESMLRAGGYATGCYTSPHLLRYNERVRLDAREAGDEALCAAFERVESARAGVPLTYFEFGTLAAMDLFMDRRPDVVLLEVGLGGRLDAVNLFDADVAVVGTVAMDHMDWLGADREAIGREKAGIFRPGRVAVCADPDRRPACCRPQQSGGPSCAWGGVTTSSRPRGGWTWRRAGRTVADLPLPALPGAFQIDNAAAALAVLDVLGRRLPMEQRAMRQGLRAARLPGRLQVIEGPVTRVLDVAHNPQSAAELAKFLGGQPRAGRSFAVLGMLQDKDMEGVAGALCAQVDTWLAATLQAPRGAPASILAQAVRRACPGARVRRCAGVRQAYRSACAAAAPGDRLIVLGSFYTVGQVLRLESCPGTGETLKDG